MYNVNKLVVEVLNNKVIFVFFYIESVKVEVILFGVDSCFDFVCIVNNKI